MPEATELARQQVQRLVENWDWPELAILEDIHALGAEAVPALIELLTPEMLEDAAFDDAANALVYYAAHLLGELKNPAAIPVLTGLYPQIAEDDDLIETVSDALSKLGPLAIAPLLTVTANEALAVYARVQACEAAVNLAGRDVLRRAQAAAVLRPLLAEYMARPGTLDEDSRLIVAVLVHNLARIADIAAQPLMEAAFDAGRVGGELYLSDDLPEILFTTREDVAKLFQQGGEKNYRPVDSFLDRYREDYQTHLAEPPRPVPEPLPDPPLLFRGPKLGRNDPCWCGSGKKYKKCHLAQDEKDKVRL